MFLVSGVLSQEVGRRFLRGGLCRAVNNLRKPVVSPQSLLLPGVLTLPEAVQELFEAQEDMGTSRSWIEY